MFNLDRNVRKHKERVKRKILPNAEKYNLFYQNYFINECNVSSPFFALQRFKSTAKAMC